MRKIPSTEMSYLQGLTVPVSETINGVQIVRATDVIQAEFGGSWIPSRAKYAFVSDWALANNASWQTAKDNAFALQAVAMQALRERKSIVVLEVIQ